MTHNRPAHSNAQHPAPCFAMRWSSMDEIVTDIVAKYLKRKRLLQT